MNNLGHNESVKLEKNTISSNNENCFQTFHLNLTIDLFCIHFDIPNEFKALSPPLEDD